MDIPYVQYGCGLSAPTGWRNFDASPTLRFERIPLIGQLYSKNSSRFPPNVEYGDIVKRLPMKPGTASGVYCSHVLEHLAYKEFQVALTNTFELLIDGGIFRLVLPDLGQLVKNYVEDQSPEAAGRFMRESYLGREYRNRGLWNFFREYLGNSSHLWMWDYKSLECELAAVGFKSIRRARFGDSEDTKFQEVENESRWRGCLGIECKKRN